MPTIGCRLPYPVTFEVAGAEVKHCVRIPKLCSHAIITNFLLIAPLNPSAVLV